MKSETKNISIRLHKFRLQYEINSRGTKFIHVDVLLPSEELYSGLLRNSENWWVFFPLSLPLFWYNTDFVSRHMTSPGLVGFLLLR